MQDKDRVKKNRIKPGGDKSAVRLSEAVFQNTQRHVAEIMCIKHPDRVKRLSCVTTEVRHMDKSSRIKLQKDFLLSPHPNTRLIHTDAGRATPVVFLQLRTDLQFNTMTKSFYRVE